MRGAAARAMIDASRTLLGCGPNIVRVTEVRFNHKDNQQHGKYGFNQYNNNYDTTTTTSARFNQFTTVSLCFVLEAQLRDFTDFGPAARKRPHRSDDLSHDMI